MYGVVAHTSRCVDAGKSLRGRRCRLVQFKYVGLHVSVLDGESACGELVHSRGLYTHLELVVCWNDMCVICKWKGHKLYKVQTRSNVWLATCQLFKGEIQNTLLGLV